MLLFSLLILLQTPPESASELSSKRAEQLVRQFENNSFRLREAAAREILKLGAAARPALEGGLKSPDAEVRDRCERLLPILLRNDLEQRLDRLVKDVEGKQQHDLPGWERFRKQMGEDADARQFYAKMLKRTSSAAWMLDSRPTKLAAILRTRQMEITNERENLENVGLNAPGIGGRANSKELESRLTFDAPELAFWIFASSDERVREALRIEPDDGIYFLMNDNLFERALRDSKTKQVCQKIVLCWMKSLKDDPADLNDLDNGFMFARERNIRSVLDIATSWLERKPKTATFDGLANALTTVGKFGDEKQVPLLARYLKVEEEFSSINMNRKIFHIQYRDIALAMSLHIQGLKPRAFGFEMLNNANLNFYPHYLGFETDEARKKAFSAYADWLYR
jgi:hypothetical protein